MTRRHTIDGPLIIVTRDDPEFETECQDVRGWRLIWDESGDCIELVSKNIAGLSYWRRHPLVRAADKHRREAEQRRRDRMRHQHTPAVWPDKDDLYGRDALRLDTGGRDEQDEWERMDMAKARY